jgi:formamidase
VREARRVWGVENNIYQFGHRGYVRGARRRAGLPVHVHARPGRGRYRLPWEDEVVHRDGVSSASRRRRREYAAPPRRKRDPVR